MSLGRLISNAVRLAFKDAGPFLVGALLVTLPVSAIYFVWLLMLNVVITEGGSDGVGARDMVVLLGLWSGFAAALYIVASVIVSPAQASLYMMVARRVREGRRARFGDMFAGYRRAGAFMLWGLIGAVVIPIGYLFFIAPGFYLSVVWVFAVPFMVDEGMGVGKALSASRRMAHANGFWKTFGYVFVILVLATAAGSILGILTMCLSTAFMVAALMVMYYGLRGEDRLMPDALPPGYVWEGGVDRIPQPFQPLPGAWGPPPGAWGPPPGAWGPPPGAWGPPPGAWGPPPGAWSPPPGAPAPEGPLQPAPPEVASPLSEGHDGGADRT